MERALITITSTKERFDIDVPKGGTPQSVAHMLYLISKLPRKQEEYTPGELATALILVFSKVGARLVNLITSTPAFDYGYRVTCTGRGDWTISCMKASNAKVLFTGNVTDFVEFGNNFDETGLEDIVKRVVQFRYNGGSKPGALRLVRVEHVDRSYLEGYDLEKDDLTQAYRKYAQDKIVGDILILQSSDEAARAAKDIKDDIHSTVGGATHGQQARRRA